MYFDGTILCHSDGNLVADGYSDLEVINVYGVEDIVGCFEVVLGSLVAKTMVVYISVYSLKGNLIQSFGNWFLVLVCGILPVELVLGI